MMTPLAVAAKTGPTPATASVSLTDTGVEAFLPRRSLQTRQRYALRGKAKRGMSKRLDCVEHTAKSLFCQGFV